MKAASPPDPQTLVVIRFSALGDVAMTVPVLLAFAASYPDVDVRVCIRPKFQALFNSIPNVKVLPANLDGNHSGLLGLLRLYKQIRNEKPKAILDLHNVLRTRILRSYNGLNRIPYYVLDKGRAEKRRLTRPRNKKWQPLSHTTQRYAAVFEAAGYPLSLSDQHLLPPRRVQDSKLHDTLEGFILIGIAPFAAHDAKMYDPRQLEEVIAWLNTRSDCRILIFGGGKLEQQQARNWEEQYSNCMNLIGKYDFDEELNVISSLDLMLSMDSGNGHLSAIFGVPTLTLWGVTHPYTGFAPYNQPDSNSLLADRSRFPAIPTSVYGNHCPQGYQEAINTIPVSLIKERIKAILGWN